MSEVQNIVVIGASQAGHNFANSVVDDLPGTHRVLLIDALDYGFWPSVSIRASIHPGWEKRSTIPLKTETVFKAGSAHRLIAPNRVLELKDSSVVLEQPFEGSTEIPFFKCILATGSHQPLPMRPAPGMSESEYREVLLKLQRDITKATKIVIIGGGAVGIEFSGETLAVHPNKSITVVHTESMVLNPTASPPDLNKVRSTYTSPPTAPKLSAALERDLKALKVNLILNDKARIPKSAEGRGEWDGSFGLQDGIKTVTLESGKKIEADYVIIGIGNKPNVSLVDKADPGAIVSGLVGVDEYLRVISTNEKASPLVGKYYAIGDCCSTPGLKNALGAMTDGVAAAANVLADVKKTSLKPYTRPLPYGLLIPLGPNKGQGSLTVPWLGQVMLPTFVVKTVKAQKLFTDDFFFGRFKGSERVELPPIPA